MPDELGRPCMQHDPMPCGPHYSPIFQPDTSGDADPTPPPVPAEALNDARENFWLLAEPAYARFDELTRARLSVAFESAANDLMAVGRTAAAADIRAALAEDLADSDVSSGEAIWEQGGYRQGLAAAAEIAAEVKP